MAHYSYASPDRKAALVVEMNEIGWWAPCRLVPLNGKFPGRPIGPPGTCTSAGWSPDGSWMYFTAYVEGRSHLWRQRFPNGQPEQVTSGVTEEEGVAVEVGHHCLRYPNVGLSLVRTTRNEHVSQSVVKIYSAVWRLTTQ
jgi:hypothetical protein